MTPHRNSISQLTLFAFQSTTNFPAKEPNTQSGVEKTRF